ncbi:hypothetical protein NECAME_18041, partial [Necator americanus]
MDSLFPRIRAVEQFAKHSKRPDDLLVHYIPCNFNYRMEDDDTKKITAALNKYGEESKILVVSNTQPEEVLTKTFNQSKENVGFVGKNEEVNVATRIAEFGASKTSTQKPNTTKMTAPTTSTTSTLEPTTTTAEPTTTSTVEPTTTTAEPTTTSTLEPTTTTVEPTTTSTPEPITTTAEPTTTSTLEPTTTTAEPTTTSTP